MFSPSLSQERPTKLSHPSGLVSRSTRDSRQAWISAAWDCSVYAFDEDMLTPAAKMRKSAIRTISTARMRGLLIAEMRRLLMVEMRRLLMVEMRRLLMAEMRPLRVLGITGSGLTTEARTPAEPFHHKGCAHLESRGVLSTEPRPQGCGRVRVALSDSEPY